VRDGFSARVKDVLAKRVGLRCSNPECKQVTSGPQEAAGGHVNIGVAAHITAASPGGPRFDAKLDAKERASDTNGIWLCQSCSKLVDSDEVHYTEDRLRAWKATAECSAARALGRRRAPESEPDDVFVEAERLMPELLAEMRADVGSDATQLVCEFVLLASSSCVFCHAKPQFEYYEKTHPNLRLQVDWLEQKGLVVDVTTGNAPVYRMVPAFISELRRPT
jgi:hypothetical protein